MISVRRILRVLPQPSNKVAKNTPAFVKTATKNEQAAADYFQNATVNRSSMFFNRENSRKFNKLKLQ